MPDDGSTAGGGELVPPEAPAVAPESVVAAPSAELVPRRRQRAWPERLGEFLAIVFGILVALGGDAWWDTRVERREERDALMALRSEFTASHGALRSGLRDHERSAAAIHRLLDWTGPQPRLPAGDTVAVELYAGIVQYSTYNDRRGVLDGVIASGALRLVQNDSLRARLAGWPAVVEDLTEDEVLALELRNVELLPHVYRSIPVDGSEFPREYRTLFSDPYFERLIDWRYRQLSDVIVPAYRFTLADLEEILRMLDAELGMPEDRSVTEPASAR